MASIGATTIRGYPGPLRYGALSQALAKIGAREHGPNEGPIVDWSIEGMHGHCGQPWCGFFACQCFRRELIERDNLELLEQWAKIQTGDVDELWRRLCSRGWAWRVGEPLPEVLISPLLPERGPGQPDAGDLLFYVHLDEHRAPVLHHAGEPNLRHVGIVERMDAADCRMHTVEGNRSNCVDTASPSLADPALWGFARCPW